VSDKNTFQLYGQSFQSKIIALLLTDKGYLEQIQDILESKYFENRANRWIIKNTLEYFNKYKNAPTMSALKVLVSQVEDDIFKISIIDSLREANKYSEAIDKDFIKEKSIDFCKNQKIKDAVIKSVDLIQDGDYDAIKVLIDDALKAGTERDVGHEYLVEIEERYSESARITTPTGWDVVDDLLQGGLGNGELGVVVAPAGVGKTWVLAAIGSGAMKNNKNVVHYTLELNEAYVGLRYDSILTGVANQNLKYHKDEIKEKLEKHTGGDLIIKYFPTKSVTVNSILSHLQKLRTLGNEVDMVILDYADLLRDTGKFTKEVRHALGNIYEELRGVAGELELPIWTASQANRSSLDEEIIEAQKISESYAKIMTADFVISLSRHVSDKISNTGRFHIIKNRFGPDGITFPAKVNTNTGYIQLYEAYAVDGKREQKKMDNKNEFVRKSLASKYKDMG
tara:strand:+ start:2102 stop:3460 length:1359 start_codon:yes stop_codon:yes gene_type:complete